jgi:hypothetical protein
MGTTELCNQELSGRGGMEEGSQLHYVRHTGTTAEQFMVTYVIAEDT